MKRKLLTLIISSLGLCVLPQQTHGSDSDDYEVELLIATACRMFTGSGLSRAAIAGANEIHLRSNFGTIELLGEGWIFDTNTIIGANLGINSSLIILGSFEGKSYKLDFTKTAINGHNQLCLMSAHTIPEISSSAIISGFIAALFAFTRRK